MNYLDMLIEGSQKLNIALNNQQVRMFDTYLKQLRFFNRKFNLTTITEPTEIVTKHFLDSLSALNTGIIKENSRLVDIGAGAGFPGLAIKIVIPQIELTLLESNRKKCLFLKHMIDRLNLTLSSIVSLRVEDFGQGSGRDQFDVAITRAVSSLATSLEYAIPLLKKGGIYLAMKARLEKEAPTDDACKTLGCKQKKTQKIAVPYLDAERNIVIFEKPGFTNPKFPRRSGIPAKYPL